MPAPSRQTAILAAVGAFGIWGLFPVYWKALAHVPALEVAAHRLFWSFVAVFAFLLIRGQLHNLRQLNQRQWALLCLSGGVIASNWGIYVWAVAQERVVEASLGYFISPLMSVALGVVVLGERLDRVRWMAVGLAAAGVLWLTVRAGGLPWIALCLASSFALYGLVRKHLDVDAVTGLAAETCLWAVPAAIAVATLSLPAQHPPVDWWLLAGGGAITALPLALYALAARGMPLASLGLMQYFAPTCQLLLGVLLYQEPFDAARLAGFACIWAALALHLAQGWRSTR
ncbi:EamA family transporter RarD [Algiphilus sp.]|uniref:EamA family transporter RarD n=1 Tax=Algiphilus sp. TaxID=1872431 RepID=UPI001CA6EFCA|nr:EamA family transporter RarD [Algiphilus sp.]MBY8964383.1 EamA family transporter RarD [Algiphilus acroporae]MCI5103968.1 EamA family transporter RarD [Algiphilus sp.]